MSIKTKLLIPLLLVGIMVVGFIYIWNTTIRDISTYQASSEQIDEYYQKLLDARIELDQYLLTDLESDRLDFTNISNTLKTDTENLLEITSPPDSLKNQLMSLVDTYIEEFDFYLNSNFDLEEYLLKVNDLGDELYNESLENVDILQDQDSVYIFTPAVPNDFSEYLEARSIIQNLREDAFRLRSDTREILIKNDSALFNTVSQFSETLKNDFELATNNTYLNINTSDTDRIIDEIILTTHAYLDNYVLYENHSMKLSEILNEVELNITTQKSHLNTLLIETIDRGSNYAILMYVTGLLLLIIKTTITFRSFTIPMNKLKVAMINIANNEAPGEIDHKKDDEFGDIASTFQTMYERISSKENQLKLSNKKLERSNQELEAFAYSVSHDLRTPLRSISGFSQALMDNHHDQLNGSAKDYLNRIRNAAIKMGVLIDDILKLSRISRKEITRSKFYAKEKILQTFESELENQEIANRPEIEFVVDPEITADPSLADIVFSNLIGNAIKYSKENPNPKIRVFETTRNGQSFIAISDNGIGFDMKYVDKLFKPFQRLHSDDKYEGTGIGLATVHRVLEKHGGDIFVESELNTGTTFYFNFGEHHDTKN